MGGTLRSTSVLVALLALAPGLASAQDDARYAEARRHFELAEEHFGAARFALAIQEYQASYDQMEGHPNRSFQLYNIGRSYEEMQRPRDALTSYQRFLEEAPPTNEYRGEAETRIRNLEVIIEAEGDDAAGDDDAGQTVEASGGGDLVPAIIGFSVAGAGLASFAIFGGLALAEDGRVSELPCAQPMTCSDDELSDLRTFSLVADISIGVAAAGAIAGVVLLLTVGMDSGGSQEETVAVAPWATDTSAGLAVGGTF